MNKIFDREHISNEIKDHLSNFETRITDINYKKGIYIYGTPGSGKTEFIFRLLKDLNYDMVRYDAGDVRNKALIDTITSNNVSNRNVLDMFTKKVRKIAIVMDEIDGMNNGDKGGITALIKLIRQKKTKKQRLENICSHPIICIGNYYIDKKIKELMKVCNVFELKTPTMNQIGTLLSSIVPSTVSMCKQQFNEILMYIQGDLRKLRFVCNAMKKHPEADVLINFASLRSAYESTMETLTYPQVIFFSKLILRHLFKNTINSIILYILFNYYKKLIS
jgi:DNA polymerase III delta prime subunit